jgi:hypothetical protein
MRALEGKRGKWLGPVMEAEIVAAEEALGVVLPGSYRRFLLEFGSGIVGSHEIDGLGGPGDRVPSLLWLVEDLRKSGIKRPTQVVPFHAEGDGDYSAVLAAPLAGQPAGAVVYWSPRRDDVRDIRPGYPTLEDWFAARVR